MSNTTFNEEEIKAAKETRSKIIMQPMGSELKAIYMAGEICMWDEIRKSTTPPTAQEGRTKEEWLREYEILRRVMNVGDAIWELVSMIQQDFKDHLSTTTGAKEEKDAKCKCENLLTEKEIFYGQCLKCGEVYIES